MKKDVVGLERLLSVFLSVGTVFASSLIAFGLLPRLFTDASSGMSRNLMTVGVATIIVMPVLRVVLMALSFLYLGDRTLAAVALLVLVIIAGATVLGGSGV